jgi:DUF438 domain-containing protein
MFNFPNKQYEHPNQVLLNLNNAAKNVYMEIAKAIEWPFKNEEKFVRYMVDVASVAEKEGNIVKAKNYLENLFNMCEAVKSIWQSLPPTWLTKIHDQIRDKLEMPIEWYSKMHAAAYPDIQGHEVTEEMLYLRVELLLAKTLLVYERLNRFYK